jgi:DHA1 family tetracycline resistance protein-like MFS transporter
MSDDIESGGGSHGSYAASSDNGSEAISSHPPPIILPTGSEPLANATGGSEAILPSSNSVPIHPQLKSIFLYLLLHASTLGIIALAVPQLLLRIYDDDSSDSAFAQSLISALTGVIGLLAFPTIGMLSDHYGRKPFILSALLGSATAFLLIGAINTLGALIAAAIVRGFTDVSYTISFAVLGDVTPKSFFLATYGRLSASGALGIVCGPILALICFQIDADRTAFFLAAFIELCNIVWISVKFKETLFWFDREAALQQGEAADQLPQPVRETFREMCARRTLNPFKALLILRTSPALWLLAFALFLSMIGFTGMLSVFFLFTHEKYKWGATENAANVLLFGVCSIVANALLLPWLLKKSGVTEQRLLALSVGCSLAQNLLWAFLPASVAWVIFLSSPVLMPSMILIALLRGLISRQIEPNKQGELQGPWTENDNSEAFAALDTKLTTRSPFHILLQAP